MTPAEHRAEAERLLADWQEMGSNDSMMAAGQWLQDRDHFIACAHIHAILAGLPPGLPPERPTMVVNLAGNPTPEELRRIHEAVWGTPEDAA